MNTQYPFKDLFLRLSLYETISIETNSEIVQNLLSSNRNYYFDCYCIGCKKESTFRLFSNMFASGVSPDHGTNLEMLNRFELPNEIHFSCQRDPQHKYSYHFKIQNSNITKVGQYPSMADIEIPGIQKYEKLLKRDYRDFSKAIGLHSHGIGAGSFVYLRRIFENLIEDMHKKSQQENDWDDELYQRSKMDEKIKLLKNKLPDDLVHNRAVYGIMSKGIHELTESECLGLFPDVKLGIELILDEKLYQLERESKRKTFSSFVSNTTADLKQ
ncbi:hypothetical protein [Lysinibacillus sp. NPDC059133]|uniref:hypothetical protein n=1 Tax=Lysinibacillus sp. NPDC059133 TaxID=3346737 RepID=UPI0036C1908E